MTTDLQALAQQAREAAKTGDMAAAERLNREILSVDDANNAAAFALIAILLHTGRRQEAVALMQTALSQGAPAEQLYRSVGAAFESMDLWVDAAQSYLGAAQKTAAAPVFLFSAAYALARAGATAQAKQLYYAAFERDGRLRLAWCDRSAPADIAEKSKRGVELLYEDVQAAHDAGLAEYKAQHLGADLSRLEDGIWSQWYPKDIPYTDPKLKPQGFFAPQFPPTPVFDGAKLEWVRELESEFEPILSEFKREYSSQGELTPYIESMGGAYQDDLWRPLEDNRNWGSFHLYKYGQRNEALCARFPVAASLAERMPLVRSAEGTPLELFFSVLAPGTEIPPHYGLTNLGVTVHLPLIVPEAGDLGLRVADHTFKWTPGEAILFDDCFEHEAWNRTDRTRVVLIFEVWRPEMTEDEIAAAELVMKKHQDWVDSLKADA